VDDYLLNLFGDLKYGKWKFFLGPLDFRLDRKSILYHTLYCEDIIIIGWRFVTRKTTIKADIAETEAKNLHSTLATKLHNSRF